MNTDKTVKVTFTTEPKRAVIEHLLSRGSVGIYADTRVPGVIVPDKFNNTPSIKFRFGYGLRPPIDDLLIADDELSGTLSFSGQPFHCRLPLSSVFLAMLDGDDSAIVWLESMPSEILSTATHTKKERHLRSVE